MDINPVLFSIVALFLSLCSTLVSILTFWRNSPKKALQARKDDAMRHLCSVALVNWENAQLFAGLVKDEINEPDRYLFIAAHENTKKLDNSLDSAIAVGLDQYLVGEFPYARELFVAFRGAITEVTAIQSPSSASINSFTKLHYVFGLVRLIDSCLQYKAEGMLAPTERQRVSEKIENMRQMSRNYILDKE